MGELFAPWHLLIILAVAVLLLLPAIFYLLALQKLLQKCSPASRTMEPGLVWLLLIPFVNLVFNFMLVLAVAKSLRNEFNRRGIAVADPAPGQSIGIAMCICLCCSMIPFLGLLSGIAHFALWIIYWVKIVEFSRMLDAPPQWATPYGVA